MTKSLKLHDTIPRLEYILCMLCSVGTFSVCIESFAILLQQSTVKTVPQCNTTELPFLGRTLTTISFLALYLIGLK